MRCKVSFIVPIYNMEKYLDKCISSICYIHSQNIEIILIDDGSTDKSAEICDKYANMDNRIKVIHKLNEGVSAARNLGINIARGDWLCFIDADDWLDDNFETNILERLNSSIDMLYFGVYRTKTEKKAKNINNSYYYFVKNNISDRIRCKLLNNDIKVLENGIENMLYTVPFGKFYKRSILINNHINFEEELVWGEDIVFNFDTLRFVETVGFIEGIGYYYRINDDSITQRYDEDAIKYYVLFMKALKKRMGEEKDKIQDKFPLCIIRQFLFVMQRSVFNPNAKKSFSEIKVELNRIRNSEWMVQAFKRANLKEFRLIIRIPALLLKYRQIYLLGCLYKLKYLLSKINF